MTEQQAIEWEYCRAIDLIKRIKIEETHERYIDRHKALDMAISALEEIQKYREIERDLERYHANVDIPRLIRHFIDTVFEGEKHEGFCILTNEDADAWEAYKAIGTVEECREAREKQRAKKIEPIGLFERCYCPNCLGKIREKSKYCLECGQKLDWSEEE